MIYGSYIYDLTKLALLVKDLGYACDLYGVRYKHLSGKESGLAIVEGLQKAITVQAKNIIVVDSKPALALSNVNQLLYDRYTDFQLQQKLKTIITNTEPLQLQIVQHSLADIVDRITTKSILTDIQTLVNKITPYDLRKQVHQKIIAYAYGAISAKELFHFLLASPKLKSVYDVCRTPQLKTIRHAVIEYRKCMDEELIAKEYSVHTFEILYIYNSYKKLGA